MICSLQCAYRFSIIALGNVSFKKNDQHYSTIFGGSQVPHSRAWLQFLDNFLFCIFFKPEAGMVDLPAFSSYNSLHGYERVFSKLDITGFSNSMPY